MASKLIRYPEVGDVEFVKRKGQRSIRIAIKHDRVRVSMPYYTPIVVARKFLETKLEWVKEHKKTEVDYVNGMHIGKSRTLVLINKPNNSSRLKNTVLEVSGTKEHIKKSIIRALKAESEKLITFRLKEISNQLKINYKSVNFKHMSGRWGSCTNEKQLTFNVLLVQLDWRLIDYVIIHELCHTMHMNHSKEFWNLVTSYSPDYNKLRKELRSHAPVIYNTAYARPKSINSKRR